MNNGDGVVRCDNKTRNEACSPTARQLLRGRKEVEDEKREGRGKCSWRDMGGELMKSEGGKRGKLGNGAQRLLPAANSSLPTQAGKYRNDQIEDDLESKTQNRSDRNYWWGEAL